MNDKHYKNMKAQGKLLKWLDDNKVSYERALEILEYHNKEQKQDAEKNEALTQMGRYIDASKLTPTASGMSPGRCPI